VSDKKDPKKAAQALEQAAREFDLLAGEEGAGQAGGETFIQALQPFGSGAPGAAEKQEGPQHKAQGSDPALLGMTRNLKFAESLVSEQKEFDPSTRSILEGRLGQSLGNVKIYTGKFADMAARSLGAEAFAVGRNIFFRSDKFNPSTSEGLGLLAHEATHTLQSGSGTRDEKESEARAAQAEVGSQQGGGGGGGGGSDMELALEQAVSGGGDVPIEAASSNIPGEGKTEDEDVNPADTSRAPDEGKIFEILRRAILQRMRDQVEEEFTIHGVDVYP